MSFKEKAGAVSEVGGVSGVSGVGNFAEEPEKLNEALRDFRLSIHAWSEAVYVQPRAAFAHGGRRIWRLAAGWALGCVLVAGSVSGGVWEHHRQEMNIIAAARVAEQERMATEQRDKQVRQEDEELLSKVDSDVSREVPSAMEPLAQLMAEDETR